MNLVKLMWSTPDGEKMIADMARVSAPENVGKDAKGLIRYLIKNKHWSPFEMVNVCVEINTTRDIARQILRHRSFSFQEFSQRYADVSKLEEAPLRKARLQDTKNRQNSVETDDEELINWWYHWQYNTQLVIEDVYKEALERGIAKEVARSILPEGLTMSRMYMNGTLRSWMHFIDLRSGNGTQKECQEVAVACRDIITPLFPATMKELLSV